MRNNNASDAYHYWDIVEDDSILLPVTKVNPKEKLIYTYMMTDGRSHKIGKSVNVESRLNQLQIGNPHLVLICKGTGIKECQLHRMYSAKKLTREWFTLSNEDVEAIKELITKEKQNEE